MLTDDLAARLLEVLPTPPPDPRRLLQVLHSCTFVVERNSQWHLEPAARRFLLALLLGQRDVARRVTAAIVQFAQEADRAEYPPETPKYLLSELGLAYHTAISSPSQALEGYAEAFRTASPGVAWLTGVLAEEQQEFGLLPADAVQPAFYRGMTCYREGDYRAAKRYLSRVAACAQIVHEVGVALHLLGVMAWRRDHRATRAQELLDRSLRILERTSDRHGQAQVCHTLGQLLWPSDQPRAVELLERSLGILEHIDDEYGEAQVCHTLGRLLWPSDQPRAVELLERSLGILEHIGDERSQGQVLASWADLAERPHTAESDAIAEEKAKAALQVGRDMPHTAGVCWRVLSYVYKRRGDYGRAADAVEALIAANHRVGLRQHEQVNRTRLAQYRERAARQS
ncbi:MAG: hypothetical protein KKI08_10945 [Armatimonadetes bacterium]|nr:hypothetical protein [Armatimonadota bacterium]